jgi:hypothetical protein
MDYHSKRGKDFAEIFLHDIIYQVKGQAGQQEKGRAHPYDQDPKTKRLFHTLLDQCKE